MIEKPEQPEAMASIEIMPPIVFLKEAEQKAPSMEVQAGLIREAALNIPALRYECWQQMNAEQRLQVLNALEDQLADISLKIAGGRIVLKKDDMHGDLWQSWP